jgi:hypothetical protein
VRGKGCVLPAAAWRLARGCGRGWRRLSCCATAASGARWTAAVARARGGVLTLRPRPTRRPRCFRYVPTAVLSRQTAGIRGRALIINLPGKPKSIRETFDEVFKSIPYCIQVRGGGVQTRRPGRGGAETSGAVAVAMSVGRTRACVAGVCSSAFFCLGKGGAVSIELVVSVLMLCRPNGRLYGPLHPLLRWEPREPPPRATRARASMQLQCVHPLLLFRGASASARFPRGDRPGWHDALGRAHAQRRTSWAAPARGTTPPSQLWLPEAGL